MLVIEDNGTTRPVDGPVDRRDEYDSLVDLWEPDPPREYPPARLSLPYETDYRRHVTDAAKWLKVTERNLAYTVELRAARVAANRRNRGAA
jgi:hypothetical protein